MKDPNLPEIKPRIVQTIAALSSLKIIWRDKNITLAFEVKLIWTLILSTFICTCESWTFTVELDRLIQTLGMRCYRKLLNLSYKDQSTNEEVGRFIQETISVNEPAHEIMVKKRKLSWYGRISSMAWRRQVCRGQWTWWKELTEEEDRRRDRNIT